MRRPWGGRAFVTEGGELVYAFEGSGEGGLRGMVSLKETWIGGKVSKIAGGGPAVTRVAHFSGSDPARWRSEISTWEYVDLGEVYPGIGMKLKAYGNNIEKLFFVEPGADPGQIRAELAGQSELTINPRGELEAGTALGTVAFSRPVAYQLVGGVRRDIEVSYCIEGDTYGFSLGAYDASLPLVIDPLLASTFLGTSSSDNSRGVAVDAAGNVYVAGRTRGADFPTTAGVYDASHNGNNDIFIAKLDADLQNLLACTFLGGSGSDWDSGYYEYETHLVIAADGNVYVTGCTNSTDFPIVPGAYDASFGGGVDDGFIAKLDGSLQQLLASTYIGGGDHEQGNFLALSGGHVYLLGGTGSNSLPTTPGAYATSGSGGEPWIGMFDSNLQNLVAGTYLGGSGTDNSTAMDVDDAGNVYVTGWTESGDFPTTAGAYDEAPNGGRDVYVAKMSGDLATLLAATFLGGSGADMGTGVRLNSAGEVYVTGYVSAGFPTTPGSYDETYNGGNADVFVARLNSTLSQLSASTFVGGSGHTDVPWSIALDQSGQVYVTGYTYSTDYPVSADAYDSSHNGDHDVFLSKLDGNLTNLGYSTFIGGAGAEMGYSTAVDAGGKVYLAGFTTSSDFPTISGAYDESHSGDSDAFVLGLETEQDVAVAMPDVDSSYDQAISIPVEVDDTTGRDIVSAEVFLAYDGDLLTATGTDLTGTLLSADWSVEINIVEGVGTSMDTIKIAMATDDDVLTGAGALINVDFRVADIRHPASSPLMLAHVLLNDGTPENATTDGSVTLVGVDGTITSVPEEIIPRWSIDVTVDDADEDRDAGSADSFAVMVTNGGQTETLTVTETDVSTGVFTGTIGTVFSLASTSAASSGDDVIQAKAGDQIVFAYDDSLDADGVTVERTDFTDVIGGTDGEIRVTVVTQPGDTVRVRVMDADLNTDVGVQETTTVVGVNDNTGESETITLTEMDADDAVFFGIVETTYGALAGTDDDGVFNAQKGDELVITYADTLLANGGTADVLDIDFVVDPFGDADANGSVQAFDAARVLYHALAPYLTGLDSLSANVDLQAPFGEITPYDAALILQKRVGLIDRFEVQEDESANHPQPETDDSVEKRIVEERVLTLHRHEGYVSVWADEREGIVSGDLRIDGVAGSVVMGEELAGFLSASREMREGLRVVFAGAEGVSGPGELLRVAGVGPEQARLTRALLNDGWIGARVEATEWVGVSPRRFALHANAPNPFNPQTVIRFDLPGESTVELAVFDVVGQRVRTLVAEQRPAGAHRVVWDGRDAAGVEAGSGIYFYRLRAGDQMQMRRMLLMK